MCMSDLNEFSFPSSFSQMELALLSNSDIQARASTSDMPVNFQYLKNATATTLQHGMLLPVSKHKIEMGTSLLMCNKCLFVLCCFPNYKPFLKWLLHVISMIETLKHKFVKHLSTPASRLVIFPRKFALICSAEVNCLLTVFSGSLLNTKSRTRADLFSSPFR